MFCCSYCCAIVGMEVMIVQVETDESGGLPFFQMVGFLSSEAKEAKDRVRIAIQNSGFLFPNRKVTVNLSPADVHKAGTGFDLAIACSILSVMGQIPQEELKQYLIIGELGLDGSIHGTSGVLPMIIKAKEEGFEKCIVPRFNVKEACLVEGIEVYSFSVLSDVVLFFQGKYTGDALYCSEVPDEKGKEKTYDFCEVQGQQVLKRAIEIAVAGMHNILMIGSAGAGKSMIAKRIPGIMPLLTKEEQLEVTKIYSVAGLLDEQSPLIMERPFRAPHHSVTPVAMIGGGRNPKPGEVSLADRGVLFLDELPEFPRNVIELLRQPLEDGIVTISRLNASYPFPAHLMLVCAMNPGLCGFYPDRNRCSCTTIQRKRYIGKISRPFLDRIDIFAEAYQVDYRELLKHDQKEETSEEIRNRIIQARQIQKERYQDTSYHYNSELDGRGIEEYCSLNREGTDVLMKISEKQTLSARSFHKLIKTARTIADLEGVDRILPIHIKEAAFYRESIQKYWRNEVI